jgi:hypothetical protein
MQGVRTQARQAFELWLVPRDLDNWLRKLEGQHVVELGPQAGEGSGCQWLLAWR